MDYREYLPHQALQQQIECYWMISGKKATNFRPIYPDGCMDIIINLGSKLMLRNAVNEEVNHYRQFVVGNMTSTVYSRSISDTRLLGIRFRPGALCQWLDLPMNELTDARVELSEVLKDLPHCDLLSELSDTQQIEYLNRYLLRNRKDQPHHIMWRVVLQKIIESKGRLPIGQLHSNTNLSTRQLERHFKMYVGLSPKQLSRVVRFRHVKEYLGKGRKDSPLGIAADLGFTDHAHLTNFFKEFADITPTGFERQSR